VWRRNGPFTASLTSERGDSCETPRVGSAGGPKAEPVLSGRLPGEMHLRVSMFHVKHQERWTVEPPGDLRSTPPGMFHVKQTKETAS
jgi:hypothetical protein